MAGPLAAAAFRASLAGQYLAIDDPTDLAHIALEIDETASSSDRDGPEGVAPDELLLRVAMRLTNKIPQLFEIAKYLDGHPVEGTEFTRGALIE